MGLTGVYNAPVSEEEGIAIIKEAFSKGVTFLTHQTFMAWIMGMNPWWGRQLQTLGFAQIMIISRCIFLRRNIHYTFHGMLYKQNKESGSPDDLYFSNLMILESSQHDKTVNIYKI